MNTQENSQQKIKSQIQLLKQKYLKKNIAAPKIQDTGNTKIQQHQQTKINNTKNSKDQFESKQIQKKSKQVQKINQIVDAKAPKIIVQNPKQSNWSMKMFIESQSQNKKQQQKCIKQQYQLQQQFNQKDPFGLKINFTYSFGQAGAENNTSKLNCPQFQQIDHNKQIRELRKNSQVKQHKQEKSLNEACKLWVDNPKKALSYLLFQQEYRDDQSSNIQLISRNPKFPGIVKNLAQQFVFRNEKVLKQKQKQVVYKMALQYFSPSAQFLSDILLVCLVKIVPNYSSIYLDEIIRKMPFYMQKIVKYRKYLLKQEIEIFIKCIQERMENLRADGYEIPIQSFIWMLIIKPTSNYSHQMLLTKNIQNVTQLLSIFCILYPDGKQISLSILYLKCIDGLIGLFVKSAILQKVIKHINQIKVPQVLYKPVKSLKLKLIKAADPKQDKKKGQQQKGFTNFLSDKIAALKEVVQNKTKMKYKTELSYNVQTGLYEPVPSTFNAAKSQN